MTRTRRLLALALVAALALTLAAVASGARPGGWVDADANLVFTVDDNRKQFRSVNWYCKRGRRVVAGWPEGEGLRIRGKKNRFSYDGIAMIVRNGQPVKQVNMKFRGRFVRPNRRARGTISATGCAKTKFVSEPGGIPGES
jgi:hypothetical protein